MKQVRFISYLIHMNYDRNWRTKNKLKLLWNTAKATFDIMQILQAESA